MATFYDILGIRSSASDDEIKSAYRRAAMRWHPDRNQDNRAEAEARFKELSNAYLVLSDAATRAGYDASQRGPAGRAEASRGAAYAAFLEPLVEFAETLAAHGHGREAVQGALRAKGCPEALARHIADDVVTRHAAQQGAEPPGPAQRHDDAGVPRKKARAMPAGRFWRVALPLAAMAVVTAVVLVHALRPGPGGVEAPGAGAQADHAAGAGDGAAGRPGALAALLPPAVEGFDDATGVGRIVYAALPPDPMFDMHRNYLGSPYELRRVQSLALPDTHRTLVFFASRPLPEAAGDPFGCQACQPILSVMLLQEGAAGGPTLMLPLQPLLVAGSRGTIDLQGDRAPAAVQIGPEKAGFLVRDGVLAQGFTYETARLYGVGPEGVRFLGIFSVHTDAFGTAECARRPRAQCPQSDTQLRFTTASSHLGHYDLTATERSVVAMGGEVHRAERDSRFVFDGNQYALPAAGGTTTPSHGPRR